MFHIIIVYVYSETVSRVFVHFLQTRLISHTHIAPMTAMGGKWRRPAVAPPCAPMNLVVMSRRMGGVVVLCASVLLGVITATNFFRADAADAAMAQTKVIPTVRNDCKRPSTMF